MTALVDQNARPLMSAMEVVATRMENGAATPARKTTLLPDVQPLGGSGAHTLFQTSVENMRWREWYNPLRDLTMNRVITALEAAARGILPDLMWMMYYVEQKHYVTRALLERRQTAIEQLDLQARVPQEYKKKKAGQPDDENAPDPSLAGLAQDQQGELEQWLSNVENGEDLIASMTLAPFRGFSIAQPVRDDGRTVDFENCVRFAIFDQWNFCREGRSGDFFFNPRALQQMPEGLGESNRVARDSMILRDCAWPISHIAIVNALRAALVEKNWDAHHEIFGIPNPIIIGPPSVPKGQESAYFASAQLISMGGGGYLPNGSEVFYPTEKAGVAPFKERMEHLEKEIILVGTGGMETMLSAPASALRGKNEGHADAWAVISRAEAKRMGRVLKRDFVRKFLAAKFPGRPCLAYLALQGEETLDPSQVCTDSGNLAPSGYRVKQSFIEEATGYELEPMPAGEASQIPNLKYQISKPTLALNRATAAAANADDSAALVAATLPDLAAAQHAKLAIVAKPLLAILADAEKPEADPKDIANRLLALRDQLPSYLKDMAEQHSTAAVLEKLAAASFANGIAEGVKP